MSRTETATVAPSAPDQNHIGLGADGATVAVSVRDFRVWSPGDVAPNSILPRAGTTHSAVLKNQSPAPNGRETSRYTLVQQHPSCRGFLAAHRESSQRPIPPTPAPMLPVAR